MASKGIMRIFKIATTVWSMLNLIVVVTVTTALNLSVEVTPWYEVAGIDVAIILHAMLWAAIAYGIIRLIMYFIDYAKEK